MNNLQKLILALDIKPNIELAVLILITIFLIAIAILYICIPFFLLRIRKEIIEMNKNLRFLYALQTQTKTNRNNEITSDESKYIYGETSCEGIKRFQLDDKDLKKLQTLECPVE